MSSIIFQFPCRDGQSGLELEAVRHHYSSVTPSYGCRLANAVLQALDEAAACALAEISAATKIQATFRMHQRATAFRDVRRKACAIQRTYRGYATRKRLAQERATIEQLHYLQTVFDVFATRIQSCYRGYRSRKTTSNYYAQQAYIHEVTARSLNVLRDAHRTRAEQDTLRAAEAQRVHALDYARRTAQMHHSVSTFAIPSVYLRPPATSGRVAQALQTTGVAAERGGDASGAGAGRDAGVTVGRAIEDYELEQVAVFTAGEKLEDDIRHNSRAARRTAAAETSKAATDTASRGKSGLPQGSAGSSSPPPSPPSGSRPLNAAATSRKAPACNPAGATRVEEREQAGAKPVPAVAWEDAAATAPQRPLLSQSKERATTTAASVCVTADGVANSVSSFHRKFGVRRHDCIEHDISCHAGSSRKVNGTAGLTAAAATTFPGPLSMAKESAALERSVNSKIIKSVHGDAVFKVPAGRGKRT